MPPPEPREEPDDPAAVAIGAAATATASARKIVVIRLASLGVIFAASIVIARTLGPDGRGAHAFYVALTVLLSAILGFSAPTGGYILATRHRVPVEDLAANGMWLALLAGVLATGITVAIQALVPFLPQPLAAIPAWPLLVLMGVTGFTMNTHQLQLGLARGRSIAGAVISFGPYTVAAIGYLLLPVSGGGLAAALWVFAVAPYVVAVVAGLVRPPLSVVAFGWPRPGLAARAIRQGLRTYPGELAGIVHQRADVVLLGILAPAASVGIYVVAYQSVEPILILATAGTATILALGHTTDAREGGAVTARLIRETVLIGGLLAVLAAVLAPILVPVVYGPAFADAVGPLIILLPGIVALAVARVAMSDILRRNLLEWLAGIAIIAAALNVGLNLALIPIAGPSGAALASLGSYVLLAAFAIAVDLRAGGFAARTLIPTSADVADVLRAWSPRTLFRPDRRPPTTSGRP
jgi:O-antigen/teichoic acid export membrane protein